MEMLKKYCANFWKKGFQLLLLGFLSQWALPLALEAQQFPISDIYISRPGWMNPASVGTTDLNKFFISHQQRRTQWDNWRSISQFVNYSSGPTGKRRNFGWGFFINNDIEHTEQRLGISFAIGAQIVHTQNTNLSVGINLGMLDWGSNYDKVKVYDRTDVLLAGQTNFAELDAGAGLRYSYSNYFIRSELNAVFSQLPGNLISKRVAAFDLVPHFLAGGSALFTPDNNFFIGPLAFYRNTVLHGDTTIQTGQLDIGAKVMIDRWGIWASGAYRINKAAVTAGFGIKILNPDTLFEQQKTAIFLDLSAMSSYPLNASSVFGPSFELGLILSFGRVGELVREIDTLKEVRGSFWKNDGNINNHLYNRLKRNAPTGLTASTAVTEKTVSVNYEWDDNMYMYVGLTPKPIMDTLLDAVGKEWIGVDGILSNLVTEVAREALHPDTTGVEFPDSLEPLKDLISIEIGANLKVDELEADFGAQGMIFNDDLPEKNGNDSVINMRVIYSEHDTVITIKKDQHLSNLQLSCLKLYSMRKKFEYEFNKHFGTDMAFVWEGQRIDPSKVGTRKVVYIKPLVITPDNPNQKPFQVSEITLNFTRYPNYFANQALAASLKGNKVTKEEKERRKRKNYYRDLVK